MKTYIRFSGTRISVATQSRRRTLVVLMYSVAGALAAMWTGGLIQFTPCFVALSAWMLVFRLTFGGDPNGGLTEPFEKDDERETIPARPRSLCRLPVPIHDSGGRFVLRLVL